MQKTVQKEQRQIRKITQKKGAHSSKIFCAQLQVGFRGVPAHHPVAVKVVCNFSNRVLHYTYPIVTVPVECWNNQILQFGV